MKTLKDVQNSPDSRGINIQKAGVRKVNIPLLILTRDGTHQQVLARVSLGADLAHRHRGTHMSRFMEILNRWSRRHISSVQIREILEETSSRLDSRRAQVSVRFKYFLPRTAPVTGSTGFMDYDCLFYGIKDQDQFSFILGVRSPVHLLCPCSREISRHGAHNQRADVTLRMEYLPGSFVWIEELVDIIEKSGSSPVYPVIKREDEKAITESAYDNPRFVEDVLRELVEVFRTDSRVRWFEAQCDSYESIHNHNAFAYQKEILNDPDDCQLLIPMDRLHMMF